jgi:large subunit ribosomal protein L13
MLPKNTLRDRRLERLRIYPGEAPPEAMGNVLRTWRDETGGQAFSAAAERAQAQAEVKA